MKTRYDALSVAVMTMSFLTNFHGYAGERIVYVSVAKDQSIARFQADKENGELKRLPDFKVDGAPGSIAMHLPSRCMFVSLRSAKKLASFRIKSPLGELELINAIDGGADSAYVACDRTRKYLLSASYSSGLIQSHRIGDDGALVAEAIQSVPTAMNAHCIQTDPSNRFAFVPHTGPNAVYQFRFDVDSGKFEPNSPPTVSPGGNAGPRHLAFHPNGRWVYTSDELGSSASLYEFDMQTGILASRQTISTLPADFAGKNTCSHVEVDPTGRFVLVANRGHDSIAVFSVDQQTGMLTSTQHAATEATPRAFNMSPDGHFAYVAGQASGKMAAYKIVARPPTLVPIAVYDVGPQPSWVLTVDLP